MDQKEQHEVVWISHKHDEKCVKCGKEIYPGDFIQMNRKDGIRCLKCAGYDDLVFLPSGDAKVTRRASQITSRLVVVVKWSRARKRHERQGILVDERAYDLATSAAPDLEVPKPGKDGPSSSNDRPGMPSRSSSSRLRVIPGGRS